MVGKTQNIINFKHLWNRLAILFDDLENDRIEQSVVAELNNTAGKMIGIGKVITEYYALLGEKPDDITFLQSSDKKTG